MYSSRADPLATNDPGPFTSRGGYAARHPTSPTLSLSLFLCCSVSLSLPPSLPLSLSLALTGMTWHDYKGCLDLVGLSECSPCSHPLARPDVRSFQHGTGAGHREIRLDGGVGLMKRSKDNTPSHCGIGQWAKRSGDREAYYCSTPWLHQTKSQYYPIIGFIVILVQ